MHGITQPPYQGSSHYSLAILFHRLPPPLSFYLSITIMPRAYILMGINAAELSVLGVRGLIASYLPSAVRMYHGRLSLRGTISTSSFIIRWDSALLHDDLHTCDFIHIHRREVHTYLEPNYLAKLRTSGRTRKMSCLRMPTSKLYLHDFSYSRRHLDTHINTCAQCRISSQRVWALMRT